MEEWRDVVGFEGRYKVSNLGRVRSYHGGKVRYLKSHKDKGGYMSIALFKNGKIKNFFVHRLVYTSFVGEIPEGRQIDHVNTVRDDNRIENLRVVSPRENNRNPITAERKRDANRRKAKDSQWLNSVREGVRRVCNKPIVQLDAETGDVIREWQCARDACRALGIDYRHISKCCNGKQKTAGGYRWKFA